MTSTLYHRFVKLCKSWPIDESKTTLDFGMHLRNQLLVWFPKGPLTKIDDIGELDKQISSLERLNNDVHKRKYSDSKVSKLNVASMFTKDEIQTAMSSEYLKQNEEMRKAKNQLKISIQSLKVDLKFLASTKESNDKTKESENKIDEQKDKNKNDKIK